MFTASVVAALIALTGTAFADDVAGKQDDGFVPTLFLSTPATPEDPGRYSLSFLATHFERSGGRDADFSLELDYGVTDRLTLGIEAPYVMRNQGPEDQVSGLNHDSDHWGIMFQVSYSPR